MPISATIRNGSNPSAKLVHSHNITWRDTAGVWNYTLNRGIITRQVDCASVIDHMPKSPSQGRNISICFYLYDINLTNTKFGSWDPGNLVSTNITANLTAIFSFPVMNRTDNTPDTPGSRNTYNATISVSQAGKVNLTNEIPGLDKSDTDVVIRLNGVPLSGNYTIGSLVLNNVGQGSQSVSVSYNTKTAATQTGGATAGSSSSSSSERAEELVYPMRIRDSVRFSIKGARHDLTLDNLENGIASYTLASNNPKPFSLGVGESAFFDTDDNGINDLNVTLRDIIFRRTTTVIREMIEVQPVITSVLPSSFSDVTGRVVRQEETTTSILQKVVEEESKFNTKAAVIGEIIAVIVLGLIVTYFVSRKKNKKA